MGKKKKKLGGWEEEEQETRFYILFPNMNILLFGFGLIANSPIIPDYFDKQKPTPCCSNLKQKECAKNNLKKQNPVFTLKSIMPCRALQEYERTQYTWSVFSQNTSG